MRLDVWFSWNIYSCMREERRGESGNEGKWKASGGENKFWIFQTAVNVFVFVFRAKTSLESFIERKFSFFLFWKISLFGQRKNGKWNFKKKRRTKEFRKLYPENQEKKQYEKIQFQPVFLWLNWNDILPKTKEYRILCHWHSLEKRFTE